MFDQPKLTYRKWVNIMGLDKEKRAEEEKKYTQDEIYKALLEEIIEGETIYHPPPLSYVPTKIIDHKICLASVKKQAEALEYVPFENLSYQHYLEICLAAINANSHTLEFVDKRLKSDDYNNFTVMALIKDGMVLKYLPEKQRSKKLCLLAVEDNGMALDYIPEELKDKELCLLAVENTGMALKYIPEELKDEELCLKAVENHGRSLEFVPEGLKNNSYDVCLAAVEEDGSAFKYVPAQHKDYRMCQAAVKTNSGGGLREICKSELPLSTTQFTQLYLIAVHNNGLALQSVPTELRSYEISYAAIMNKPSAIKYVPTILTDYKKLCLALFAKPGTGYVIEHIPQKQRDYEIFLAAVKSHEDALKFVPKESIDLKDKNNELLFSAVGSSWKALKFVPENFSAYHDLCLIAIKQNASAIEFVPEEFWSDPEFCSHVVRSKHWNRDALKLLQKQRQFFALEDYRKICCSAVAQDAMALAFVDEDIKALVIDEITVEKILSNNFMAIRHVPADEIYRKKIQQFLSQVTHIVVTKKNNFGDYELEDIYLVYANAAVRAGKTIHVDQLNLGELLEALRDVKNTQNKTLALLEHSASRQEELAGMKVAQIIRLLKMDDTIIQVTLLGCYTVRSLKLDKEKEMITRFPEVVKTLPSIDNFGLMLMLKKPEANEYSDLLKRASKKNAEADGVFVVSKIDSDSGEMPIYCLTCIKKDVKEKDPFKGKEPRLTEQQLNMIQNQFVKSKKLPFPKKNSVITALRGGKGAQYLSENELSVITTIIGEPQLCIDKFSKQNPHYKKVKEIYPFLTNVSAGPGELDKLKKSFMKLLIHALLRADLKRKITVKGFTKALIVDAKNRRLLNTAATLYVHYRHPIFHNPTKEFLDYKELKEEREALTSKFEGKKLDGETDCKSITMTI